LEDEYMSLRTHKDFSSVHYREPRGFGFAQYYDPDDAADAKYFMDGQVVFGRQITVVFAEENRKKPQEMRARDRVRFVGSSQCNYLATECHTASLFILSLFFAAYCRGHSYDRRYSRSRSPRYYRGRSPSRSQSYSRYACALHLHLTVLSTQRALISQ